MRCSLVVTVTLMFSSPLHAQQGVQLPVVSATSVNTTVSVPDRGSAMLGGVSSAQSARSQYGPLRTGSSRGLSRQATSISTNVYIHDLQAMDEALLNSVSTESSTRSVPASKRAANSDVPESAKRPAESPVEKAAKFEQLARRADDAGRHGAARLHWQVAAKYGSKQAAARLAELSKASTLQTTTLKTDAQH